MAALAQMVCGGFVRMKNGRVLVGPCSCGECPPICPLSIDALWQSWKGMGTWVKVGAGENPGPEVVSIDVQSLGVQDDDLRVQINGVTLSDSRWNVGWYQGPTFLTSSVPPFPAYTDPAYWRKVLLSDFTALGRAPRRGDLLSIDLFDGWAGTWKKSPVEVTIAFADATQQVHVVGDEETGASSGTNPPVNPFSTGPHFADYYPIGSFRIGEVAGSERHRGCLRFVWVCLQGGQVQSWQVLGGEVAEAVAKVAPFVAGDGQYFFALEFFGRRLGNTPGGRTFISRDDDWVVYRWMNPPV